MAYPANSQVRRRQFTRGSCARRPLRECLRRSRRSVARRSDSNDFSGTSSLLCNPNATRPPRKHREQRLRMERARRTTRRSGGENASVDASQLHKSQAVAGVAPGAKDILRGVLDLSLHRCLTWCLRWRFIVAGMCPMRTVVRASQLCLAGGPRTMSANRAHQNRRRAGRPPAGAREGEKVKDYPQLSIRVPVEMKARLNALSAVTGLAQWRVDRRSDRLLSARPLADRSRARRWPERAAAARGLASAPVAAVGRTPISYNSGTCGPR